MTNYQKGARFEYRVRDLFRKLGYQAERKAASSPYDIIVMKNGKIKFIIDAKKTSQKNKKRIYLKKQDIEKIMKEANKLKTTGIFVYGFYRSPIFVEFAKNLKNKKIVKLEGRKKLKDFLKTNQRTSPGI